MSTNAVAYPLIWRIIGAVLVAISRASLPLLLVIVLEPFVVWSASPE